MKKNSLVVVLDTDGVIRNYIAAFVSLYNELAKIFDLDPLPRDFEPRDYHLRDAEIDPGLKDYIRERYNAYLLSTAQPYKGAKEFVDKLARMDGIRIISVTYTKTKDEFMASLDWMKRYGFLRYFENHIPADSNTRAELGEILIDDAPHNIEKALSKGRTAICIKRRWNLNLSASTIYAEDYEDLLRKLKWIILKKQKIARAKAI